MIGILAIQGGVSEHEEVLDTLGLSHRRVADLDDVEELDGFILPGGESTVMDQFMQKYGLKKWLVDRVKGDPDFRVFGTCAGLILLARYGLLNVKVERNAYGRQLASFTSGVEVEAVGLVEGHFIRAPKITEVSDGVEVLAKLEGVPVAVRQKNVWGISFHPELAGSTRLHAAIFS
jgi:5'-phosphate synthase pdxT subunit